MMPMKFFKPDEFACKCCGVVEIHDMLAHRIDQARKLAGVPFQITSGYRCENHNAYVGGKPDSAHIKGMAADIACSDSTKRYRIINALLLAGFQRVGVSHDFIHVDVDQQKPSQVMWVYH